MNNKENKNAEETVLDKYFIKTWISENEKKKD